MYQALYRKWRPRTFSEVVGQGHITQTLQSQVASGRLSHAYLFTGTRGTGKTTCAKILSRAVNCEHPVDGDPCNRCPACLGIENGSILDVLELDAASNNGVDQVRALRDEAIYAPVAVKKRVYIVDEVHMLSTAAFNALLKILEEPPEHLMFILATTELHKVPATIRSRCQQFAFKRIRPGEIEQRLRDVCAQEGIALTDGAAALLSRLADGGMRDALSLLDQCCGSGNVDVDQVRSVLGLAGNEESARLMEHIARRDTAAALEDLGRLYAAGKELGSLLGELSALARDLLIVKTAPRAGVALLTGGYDEATMHTLGELLPAGRLLEMLGQLQSAAAGLGRSNSPRTDVELCMICLCDEALDCGVPGLLARIERLEGQVKGHLAAAPARPAPSEAAPIEPVPQKASPARPAPPEAAPTEPAPQKAPPARPAPPPPAAEDTAFWQALVPALMGKVPMGEYTFLANSTCVTGTYTEGVLTVWTDEFVKGLLEKPAVQGPLAQQAARLAGRPVQVFLKEGRPAPPAPAPAGHDALDDLLARGRQWDNIEIKG